MDQQRRWLIFVGVTSVLWVVFYLLVIVPYNKRIEEYRADHPELFPETAATTETLTATSGTLPALPPRVQPTSLTVEAVQKPTTATAEAKPAEITIDTQIFRVVLTSRGGRPVSWQYRDVIPGQAQPKFIEMIPQREDTPQRELPLEVVFKESNRVEYPAFNTSNYTFQVIPADNGTTEVVFSSPAIEQLQLVKTYQFRPDSYVTRLRVVLRNLGDKAAAQISDEERGLGLSWGPGIGQYGLEGQSNKGFVNTVYDTPGGVRYYSPTKPASPVKETEIRRGQYFGDAGWAGVTDKFFLAAVIPDKFKGAAVESLVRLKNVLTPEESSRADVFRSPPFTIILYSSKFTLGPRQEFPLEYDIFVGPKRPALLREVGKIANTDLDSVLFYDSWFGWMRTLKIGLMYSLSFLDSKTGNYGVAIIILTLIIRLVMHPIAHKGMKMQAKSMAEMQKIKPLLDELNRKYKGDPAKKNQEMMRLYKEHGISPLAPLRGCLPMLIQIPIFFALYSLLNQSIDLRGASFLWIEDLAEPDKLVDLTRRGADFLVPVFGWHVTALNLLPILMGVSQYFMSKLTPTPSRDPSQKQMMLIFTIMFPVMLYNFPSGLFIYWLINNVWQTVHQLIANRIVAKPPESGTAVAKA